jgi:hypothetical protein
MRVKKEYQRWQCKEVGSSLPGPCQAVGVLSRVWALVWLVVLPSPSLALFVAWNSAALGGESWEGSIEKDIERLIQHIYIYTYIYTSVRHCLLWFVLLLWVGNHSQRFWATQSGADPGAAGRLKEVNQKSLIDGMWKSAR